MKFLTRMLRRWYRTIPRNEYGRMLWGRYFRRLLWRSALWFLGLTIGISLWYTLLPVPLTPLMVLRSVEQLADPKRPLRMHRDWVSYSELSPHLQLALVCSEDQNFLEHYGFDLAAIEKAFQQNKKGGRIRGASTISQQTAKNVFLWPARTKIRKGFEVYFTFLIESLWSKKRIMTVYLNSIEFGDGIYGAEAAARHYFNKSAGDLNRQEAALLAAVVPNPLRYSAAKPSTYIRGRQQWILRQMARWGGAVNYEQPNTPKKNN